MAHPFKPRIMYIENKGVEIVKRYSYTDQLIEGGLTGPGRIGRITFSKTGATLYYQGRSLQSLKGGGFKSNYFAIETGEHFWISGPKKNGEDALYATNVPTEIDEDVREEYWTEIRNCRNTSIRFTRRKADGLWQMRSL
jgi:hypothetical protein